MPDRRSRHFAGCRPTGATTADLRDDQRNPERRLVREESVRLFAMISERLAVISGHDDQCRTRGVTDVFEQRPQRRVDRRNLPVVRTVRVLPVERRRRPVRRVRIEYVDPGKPFRLAAGSNPVPGERDDNARRPFGHHKFRRRAGFTEAVVVDVESLVQPEPGVHRKRADERAGRVPGPPSERSRSSARRHRGDIRCFPGRRARTGTGR